MSISRGGGGEEGGGGEGGGTSAMTSRRQLNLADVIGNRVAVENCRGLVRLCPIIR